MTRPTVDPNAYKPTATIGRAAIVTDPDNAPFAAIVANLNEHASAIDALEAGGGGGGLPSGTGFVHVTSSVADTPHDVTGDVTIGASGVAALATSGVTAQAYAYPSSITFDAKGRATSATAGQPSALADMFEIVSSTATASAYGNGVRFVPLRPPATAIAANVGSVPDSVTAQGIMSTTGNVEIYAEYAMAAGNTGVVAQQLAFIDVTSGGDPSAALTTQTAGSITPGNDALKHEVASSLYTGLAIGAVTKGDVINVVLTRPTGSGGDADTHTADMRLIGIGARAV